MKRAALILAAFACASCIPRPPRPPEPVPTPPTRCFSVTVRAEGTNQGIVGATVSLNEWTVPTDEFARARICGISQDTHRGEFVVSKTPQYQPRQEVINIDMYDEDQLPPFGDVEWPDVYLQPARLFPPEVGPITPGAL